MFEPLWFLMRPHGMVVYGSRGWDFGIDVSVGAEVVAQMDGWGCVEAAVKLV